ncbi:hypothetical protein FHG87_025850, partial [Trinorchestia longiramus]
NSKHACATRSGGGGAQSPNRGGRSPPTEGGAVPQQRGRSPPTEGAQSPNRGGGGAQSPNRGGDAVRQQRGGAQSLTSSFRCVTSASNLV